MHNILFVTIAYRTPLHMTSLPSLMTSSPSLMTSPSPPLMTSPPPLMTSLPPLMTSLPSLITSPPPLITSPSPPLENYMYQYFIQIVPTEIDTLLNKIDTCQYSVTESVSDDFYHLSRHSTNYEKL